MNARISATPPPTPPPPKKTPNHQKKTKNQTPAALSPYWMVLYFKKIHQKQNKKHKPKKNPQCAQILQLKLAEDQTDSKLFLHFPNNSFNLQVSTIQLTEINI